LAEEQEYRLNQNAGVKQGNRFGIHGKTIGMMNKLSSPVKTGKGAVVS